MIKQCVFNFLTESHQVDKLYIKIKQCRDRGPKQHIIKLSKFCQIDNSLNEQNVKLIAQLRQFNKKMMS